MKENLEKMLQHTKMDGVGGWRSPTSSDPIITDINLLHLLLKEIGKYIRYSSKLVAERTGENEIKNEIYCW